MLIPLAWFVLLWRVRRDVVRRARRWSPSSCGRLLLLTYLAFLFSDYLPSMWGYELYEMAKRLFFVAVLPLRGARLARVHRHLGSCALCSGRESWPFTESTNSQLAAAALQILGVYFALLLTDSMKGIGLSDGALGGLLLLLNLVCFVLVAYWCVKVEAAERERRAWRQNLELSWRELQLVRDVMGVATAEAAAEAAAKTAAAAAKTSRAVFGLVRLLRRLRRQGWQEDATAGDDASE